VLELQQEVEMAVLHVRNIPDSLYEHAQAIAEEQGSTLSALVIELMQQAAVRHLDRKRHVMTLERMRKDLSRRKPGKTSAANLIRSAREKRDLELRR
jgi:hypothetical protein